MTVRHADLGTRPNCGAAIPFGRILTEYENRSGEEIRAECLDCSTVVEPER